MEWGGEVAHFDEEFVELADEGGGFDMPGGGGGGGGGGHDGRRD